MRKILAVLAMSLLGACGNMNTPMKGPTDEPIVDLPMNPDPPDSTTPENPPTESPTHYCQRNDRGEFDTSLKIEGGGSDKTYFWGQGGSCIKQSLASTWKLFQNQKKLAWDGTDRNEVLDSEAGADGSLYFLDKYWVTTFIITVSWEMEWFHSIYTGTVENPLSVLINYKKVRGTSHIPYWEGSIALERVTDDVTSFTMRNQIHADRTNLSDAKATISDLLTRVLK